MLLYGQPQVDKHNWIESWLNAHRLPVLNQWHGNVRLKHYRQMPQPIAMARFPGGSVLDKRFGPLILQEIRLGQLGVHRPLEVDLLWTVTQAPTTDYSASVQLYDPSGRKVEQTDGPPFQGGLPTTNWRPGFAYADTVSLPIQTLPEGVYTLRASVYANNGLLAGKQEVVAVTQKPVPGNSISLHEQFPAGWNINDLQLGQDEYGNLVARLSGCVQATPASNYTWFLHVLNRIGTVKAQDDHPAPRSMASWHPGEAFSVWFHVAAHVTPGTILELGAYDAAGTRAAIRLPDGSRTDVLKVAAPESDGSRKPAKSRSC